jgi:hypothetical protein
MVRGEPQHELGIGQGRQRLHEDRAINSAFGQQRGEIARHEIPMDRG